MGSGTVAPDGAEEVETEGVGGIVDGEERPPVVPRGGGGDGEGSAAAGGGIRGRAPWGRAGVGKKNDGDEGRGDQASC